MSIEPIHAGTDPVTLCEAQWMEPNDSQMDPLARLAAALVANANRQRDINGTLRAAERERLDEAHQREIDAMRDKADQIRAGACWKAAGGLLEGGCGIAAGGDMMAEEPSRATEAILQGSGTGVGALGDGLSKYCEGEVADLEADASQARHLADESKSRREALRDADQQSRQLSSSALEFLSKAEETEAATMRAALSQRM